MLSDKNRVSICGLIPPASWRRASSNDERWEPGTDAASAFESVSQALTSEVSPVTLESLKAALEQSTRPVDFRRWLSRSLLTASATETPLLSAYQHYFEHVAGV